jgi:hypothetical protein
MIDPTREVTRDELHHPAGRDQWAGELDLLLHSTSARSWYVKSIDAVRSVVVGTPVAGAGPT